MNKQMIWGGILSCTLIMASNGMAQSYPAKPIRMIVPYPPAGTTDFVAREVGQKMADNLTQPVIIDNRPGAGTLIGLTQGVRAPADGYTLSFGTSAGLALNPALGQKMPFDIKRDFAPVGLMVYVPYFLVVNASLPIHSVKELIEWVKVRPGEVNMASPGIGTPNHLGVEMLNMMARVKLVHVPYKGGAQAVTDLVAGQVQVMFSGTPQVEAFVKTGRLRIIATATQKANRVAPDQPTVAETFPGFDCNTWYGLLVPVATPREKIIRLNAALRYALLDPGVVQRMLAQGVEPTFSSPQAMADLIREETGRWKKVIDQAGIKVDNSQ